MVLLKSLAFLKAVAYVLAAIAAVYLPEYHLVEAVLLAVFVAVLNLFGVYPELKALGLLKGMPAFFKFGRK